MGKESWAEDSSRSLGSLLLNCKNAKCEFKNKTGRYESLKSVLVFGFCFEIRRINESTQSKNIRGK